MKFLLLTAICLFSVGSFANEEEMKGKTFEEKKQMMSTHLDKKISTLQTARTCVEAAKDDSALKKCKEQKKAAMKEMKGKMKDKKK